MKKHDKRFLALFSIILTSICMNFIKAYFSIPLRVVVSMIIAVGFYYVLEFILKLWRNRS
ncbi:MAG TPA: hypothetical protein DCL44_12615 [Elusimicrobia bacterium]|nr:hypothetical protein [Elusimicrobiota bacterium]